MNDISPEQANRIAAAQQRIRDVRAAAPRLDEAAIDTILTGARSHYAWTDKPVSDELLQQVYEITSNGPTSMNCCPARFVFVRSTAAKDKLIKALTPANVPKVTAAPVTAIIAFDTEFWKELPFLFPHVDRRAMFESNPALAETTAFRNSTLQGAYFMIAARALGLDVGAMSGFKNAVVDEEFFAGTSIKSNFICNLGYGDESALFQKLPRFPFDKVCSIQ